MTQGTEFLDLLSLSGVTMDELVRASGLSAAEVQVRLTDLEMDGMVVRLSGGRVARAG
jgi:predicted Rossmann fold nucleotide-binding protein DprA/Smf involved in DNA uptake